MSTVATPPTQPPAGSTPPEPPRRAWWLTRRVLIAAVGIVLLSGGATAVVALNEVGKVVDALGQNRAIHVSSRLLATAGKGEPETLLLVGNDQRPAPKDNPNGFVIPHSNEMLLVRIDPSKPTISMLSIPRELQVTIYPHGAAPVTTRINAAYGIGGAELMTETIKRVLGVSINHVFVLTFPKFKRAVDELGCVYMTVDRRYHHVNEPGGEQYFEINLQPGYQRLCGQEALEFVANRHEDTSLTRDARDQRFLLAAKAQYGGSLLENSEKFERILGRTVETDLHGKDQVLNLLELLVESAGRPVRQVPFNVTLLPTYDVASEQQIHESVQSFLGGTAAIHRQHIRTARHASAHHAPAPAAGLTPTTPSELEAARSVAPNLPFPLEYPLARYSSAGAEPDTLRLYTMHDQSGHTHPTYVIAVDQGQLGDYYDVQGTTWSDPPLLASPGQAVRVGGRTYEVSYAGEHVSVIAWHESGATYWVQNTLTNSLSPDAMLAIAQQTVPIFSSHAAAAINGTPVQATLPSVDLSRPAAAQAGTAATIGSLFGLVGLGLLAALGLLVGRRQREITELRGQVATALALESSLRPLLASAGLPAGETAAAPEVRAPSRERARVASGSRRLRPAVIGSLLAAAVLIAGAAVLLSGGGGSGGGQRPLPAVKVSVFNASGVAGAAHRAAAELMRHSVRIGSIGDVNTSLSPGNYVLYPPGAMAEAQRVALMLPGTPPAVEPIQPQLQEATGTHDQIVVVLD